MILLFWLISILSLLISIIIILLVKIYIMKKSAIEIKENLSEKLESDTNTLIDISSNDKDMRNLAESLNFQLKQLNEERHRFQLGDAELKEAITNISHDLRTPLTTICGYLDLLEQEEKSEKVNKYLKIISERTNAVRQLTDEMLRYSIVLSEDKDFNLEDVIVNNILEESISNFYADIKNAELIPDIDICYKKVHRMLNKNALMRIFSNIISNAIKYSDCDLKIVLTENCNIIFSNKSEKLNSVSVFRLFDRFYTVETAGKSTGLGLSIAKHLTEQMNGNIYASYKNDRLYITLHF